ncbi:MAG: G2-specific serine/threonine protein kinase [Vezdaea aestivalis]|nr:MAG: G2-specific serine/threonine protein kinase [Vezdaea aestivalis]
MSELKEYDCLEKIGHGAFGVIRKVRKKATGEILCRKEINYVRMSAKEREQLHAEFSILNTLRHPHIVRYYHREHIKASQDLYLYMEYCGNGDLGQLIRKMKTAGQTPSEDFVWSVAAQLADALHRCHYGEDPAPVTQGRTPHGGDVTAKPPKVKQNFMILHRDLKPENSEDNSVKLGDFGLSKIIQSNDFASTYVGTPFYMSPEICAAERYTHKSDMWALGCILYELCAKEVPFNARTHLQLIQRIKEGSYRQLPSSFSPDLRDLIKSLLRVNPFQRPDTAQLLNHPTIRLMRKEREALNVSNELRKQAAEVAAKSVKLDEQLAAFEADKADYRQQIEASVRREWEVKAQLKIHEQIEQQVQSKSKELKEAFDAEVRRQVGIELEKHMGGDSIGYGILPQQADEIPRSSVTTNDDADFPSTTDLTSLSLESPTSQKPLLPFKKGVRTPFGRSRTVCDSPADVHMADPSPISITSLSLSPRRKGPGTGNAMVKNLFSHTSSKEPRRFQSTTAYSSDDGGIEGEDEDDALPMPSPTQQKGLYNPFKVPTRPALVSQKTAPVPKIQVIRSGQVVNPFRTKKITVPAVPSLYTAAAPLIQFENKPNSPKRRLSKIPSSASLVPAPSGEGSPIRRTRSTKALVSTTTNLAPSAAVTAANDDLIKQTTTNHCSKRIVGQVGIGRTLVELQNERRGPERGDQAAKLKSLDFRARMENREERIWDPEQEEEMPSPFIVRSKFVRY